MRRKKLWGLWYESLNFNGPCNSHWHLDKNQMPTFSYDKKLVIARMTAWNRSDRYLLSVREVADDGYPVGLAECD